MAANKQRIDQLTQEVEESGAKLGQLESARVNKSPSWYHTLAATNMLGQAAAVALRGAGIAVGAVGGAQLAKPTAQRFIAGQTAPQKALQAAGQTSVGQAGLSLLPAAVRSFGGMMQPEQYQ